jgi:hypothetical protein
MRTSLQRERMSPSPKTTLETDVFLSLAQQPGNAVIGFLDKGLPVAMSANEWTERRHQLLLQRCPQGDSISD